MSDILEWLLHSLFAVVRYILLDLLIEFVFYYVGKGFLRACTFGKYPPATAHKKETEITMLVGFVISLLLCFTFILAADYAKHGI